MVVVALCASCGGPTGPTEEQAQLSENRERFRATVGNSYRYDYQNVCFCGPDTRREVVVTVVNGVRTSVSAIDGTSIPRENWVDYLTVEEVFDAIAQALAEEAASVRVTYDDALGYPRDVFIDFDERIADEERGFSIENLELVQ